MRKNLLLILLLPFLLNLSIVSLAYSEVEMNLTISGSDQIDAVRRGSDSLIFLMNFSGVPATELPEDSIMINGDPVSEDSLTCLSQDSGKFFCSYITPGFVANSPFYDYTVELVIGDVLASETKMVYVDNQSPVIESVEGLPEVIKKDKSYDIKVTLKDKSFEGSNFCSGLSKITIYKDSQSIKEEAIEADDCGDVEKTISLNGGELSSGKLCIYAYDKLNQPSEPFCQDIFVDSQAPVIEGFNLFYNDEPIRYLMKGKSYSVVPKANIFENGNLLPSNVYGNFSSINPSYSNLRASSCEKISEEMYECEWQPLTISLSEQKTFNIKIKANDEAGYEATKDFSVTILIDAAGPSVGSISSAYGKYGGVNYISEESKIILDITDDKSGISANNVFIDASGIMAGSKIEADSCENGKCYFNVVSGLSHLGDGEVKVHPDTRDNAGNNYNGYTSEYFIMDREAPEFHNVSIRNSRGGEGLKGGDAMTLTVYASDDTPLFIGGNFSKISNDDVEESACSQTYETNLWKCSIDVRNLIAGANGEIEYYVRDLTNNSFKRSASVNVNFPLQTQNPDYWELKDAELLGNGIDSEAISQVSQTVLVNMKFDAKAANINLTDMKISCRGTNFESTSVMLPNQVGNSIVVPVIFKIGRSTIDEPIDVSCTAELYTKAGNFLTVYPEKETINFTIPVFESSMGVSTDVMTEKIKSKVETIDSLLAVAEFANSFFEISQTICEAITGFSRATSLLNSIIEPLKDVLPAIFSFPLDTAAVSTAASDNALVSALGKFCSFATCSHNQTIPISIELPNVLEDYEIYGFETPAPGESLVYDVYTLCLPGVVSGLYDMLEIECGRLDCYGTALESGAPISYCDQITTYSYCNDIVGGIFATLPLTHTWRELGGAFRDLFSNPISFVGGIVSYACSPAALTPSAHTTLASACRVVTLADQYLELGNMLLSAYDWIADLFDDTEDTMSYCESVLSEYSEYLD